MRSSTTEESRFITSLIVEQRSVPTTVENWRQHVLTTPSLGAMAIIDSHCLMSSTFAWFLRRFVIRAIRMMMFTAIPATMRTNGNSPT
jgi:hypothetical protein